MSDTITLADARAVIAAAEKCAEEIGQPQNVAADSQSGGPLFGIHASNGGRVMIFAGGIPLRRDGKIVGAIGVSGGDSDQDQTVAEAGAGAL
jgi:uncharacterized protein GlcG (DUF336 family)